MATNRTNRKRKTKKNNKNTRLIIRVSVALLLIAVGYYIFHKFYPDYHDFDKTNFDNQFEVRGVDLSHHNRVMSWDALRDKNVSFAYLKVTEGASIRDKEYEQNYRQAKSNNIYVGTYHFFSFRTPGDVQAKHFIAEAICKKGDLLPAIDVEHSPSNRFISDKSKREKVIEQLKIFENKIAEYYGKTPVIYTNKECYELYIKDNFPKNPIWICDLRKEPSDDIKNWVIWQFSHKGKIPGTSGNIDLNYYRYSFSELKKELLM